MRQSWLWFTLFAGLGLSGSTLAESPADSYFAIALKRPDSIHLFNRFYEHYDAAQESLEAFLLRQAEVPQQADACRRLLVNLYEKEGRYQQAVELLRTLLEKDSGSMNDRYALARLEFFRNQPERAEAALQDLLAHHEELNFDLYQSAVKLAGQVYDALGKPQQAVELYWQLYREFPEDDNADLLLQLLIEQGLYSEAEKFARQWREQSEDPFQKMKAAMQLAEIALRQDNRPAALAEYEQLLEQSGSASFLERDLYAKICDTLKKAGEYKTLFDWSRRFLTQHPERLELQLLFCRQLAEYGESAEVLERLAQLVERAPLNRGVREAYAEQLAGSGRFAEADRQLQLLLVQYPDQKELLLSGAALLLRDPEAAPAKISERLRAYLTLAGNSEYAYGKVLNLLTSSNRPELSDSFFQACLAAYPDSLEAVLKYADWLYTAEKAADADALLRQAMPAFDADRLFRIANLLLKRERKATALELLKQYHRQPSFGWRNAKLLFPLALEQADRPLALTVLGQLLDAVDNFEEFERLAAGAAPLLAEADARLELFDAEASTPGRLALQISSQTEPEAAWTAVEEAGRRYPDSILLLSQKLALLERGYRYEPAIEVLTRLLDLDGRNVKKHRQRLLRLLQRTGQTARAGQLLERWRLANPEDPDHWLAEADFYQTAGQSAAALELLTQAWHRFPDLPELSRRLIDLQQQSGDLAAARALAWRLFEQAEDVNVKRSLGTRLYRLSVQDNTTDQLVARFQTLCGEDAKNPLPLLVLTDIYRQAGRMAEYEAALRKAIAQTEDNFDLWNELALFLEQNGDLDGAEAAWKRFPDSTAAKQALMDFYWRNDRLGLAFELLKQLPALQADPEKLQRSIGNLIAWRQPEAALQLIEEFAESLPDDFNSCYLRAVALESAGDTVQAIPALLQALPLAASLTGSPANAFGNPYFDRMLDKLPAESAKLAAMFIDRRQAYRFGADNSNGYNSSLLSGWSNVVLPTRPEVAEAFCLIHLQRLLQIHPERQNEVRNALAASGVNYLDLKLRSNENFSLDEFRPYLDDLNVVQMLTAVMPYLLTTELNQAELDELLPNLYRMAPGQALALLVDLFQQKREISEVGRRLLVRACQDRVPPPDSWRQLFLVDLWNLSPFTAEEQAVIARYAADWRREQWENQLNASFDVFPAIAVYDLESGNYDGAIQFIEEAFRRQKARPVSVAGRQSFNRRGGESNFLPLQFPVAELLDNPAVACLASSVLNANFWENPLRSNCQIDFEALWKAARQLTSPTARLLLAEFCRQQEEGQQLAAAYLQQADRLPVHEFLQIVAYLGRSDVEAVVPALLAKAAEENGESSNLFLWLAVAYLEQWPESPARREMAAKLLEKLTPQTMPLDNLARLAAWCRRLGLLDAGSRLEQKIIQEQLRKPLAPPAAAPAGRSRLEPPEKVADLFQNDQAENALLNAAASLQRGMKKVQESWRQEADFYQAQRELRQLEAILDVVRQHGQLEKLQALLQDNSLALVLLLLYTRQFDSAIALAASLEEDPSAGRLAGLFALQAKLQKKLPLEPDVALPSLSLRDLLFIYFFRLQEREEYLPQILALTIPRLGDVRKWTEENDLSYQLGMLPDLLYRNQLADRSPEENPEARQLLLRWSEAALRQPGGLGDYGLDLKIRVKPDLSDREFLDDALELVRLNAESGLGGAGCYLYRMATDQTVVERLQEYLARHSAMAEDIAGRLASLPESADVKVLKAYAQNCREMSSYDDDALLRHFDTALSELAARNDYSVLEIQFEEALQRRLHGAVGDLILHHFESLAESGNGQAKMILNQLLEQLFQAEEAVSRLNLSDYFRRYVTILAAKLSKVTSEDSFYYWDSGQLRELSRLWLTAQPDALKEWYDAMQILRQLPMLWYQLSPGDWLFEFDSGQITAENASRVAAPWLEMSLKTFDAGLLPAGNASSTISLLELFEGKLPEDEMEDRPDSFGADLWRIRPQNTGELLRIIEEKRWDEFEALTEEERNRLLSQLAELSGIFFKDQTVRTEKTPLAAAMAAAEAASLKQQAEAFFDQPFVLNARFYQPMFQNLFERLADCDAGAAWDFYQRFSRVAEKSGTSFLYLKRNLFNSFLYSFQPRSLAALRVGYQLLQSNAQWLDYDQGQRWLNWQQQLPVEYDEAFRKQLSDHFADLPPTDLTALIAGALQRQSDLQLERIRAAAAESASWTDRQIVLSVDCLKRARAQQPLSAEEAARCYEWFDSERFLSFKLANGWRLVQIAGLENIAVDLVDLLYLEAAQEGGYRRFEQLEALLEKLANCRPDQRHSEADHQAAVSKVIRFCLQYYQFWQGKWPDNRLGIKLLRLAARSGRPEAVGELLGFAPLQLRQTPETVLILAGAGREKELEQLLNRQFPPLGDRELPNLDEQALQLLKSKIMADADAGRRLNHLLVFYPVTGLFEPREMLEVYRQLPADVSPEIRQQVLSWLAAAADLELTAELTAWRQALSSEGLSTLPFHSALGRRLQEEFEQLLRQDKFAAAAELAELVLQPLASRPQPFSDEQQNLLKDQWLPGLAGLLSANLLNRSPLELPEDAKAPLYRLAHLFQQGSWEMTAFLLQLADPADETFARAARLQLTEVEPVHFRQSAESFYALQVMLSGEEAAQRRLAQLLTDVRFRESCPSPSVLAARYLTVLQLLQAAGVDITGAMLEFPPDFLEGKSIFLAFESLLVNQAAQSDRTLELLNQFSRGIGELLPGEQLACAAKFQTILEQTPAEQLSAWLTGALAGNCGYVAQMTARLWQWRHDEAERNEFILLFDELLEEENIPVDERLQAVVQLWNLPELGPAMLQQLLPLCQLIAEAEAARAQEMFLLLTAHIGEDRANYLKNLASLHILYQQLLLQGVSFADLPAESAIDWCVQLLQLNDLEALASWLEQSPELAGQPAVFLMLIQAGQGRLAIDILKNCEEELAAARPLARQFRFSPAFFRQYQALTSTLSNESEKLLLAWVFCQASNQDSPTSLQTPAEAPGGPFEFFLPPGINWSRETRYRLDQLRVPALRALRTGTFGNARLETLRQEFYPAAEAQ